MSSLSCLYRLTFIVWWGFSGLFEASSLLSCNERTGFIEFPHNIWAWDYAVLKLGVGLMCAKVNVTTDRTEIKYFGSKMASEVISRHLILKKKFWGSTLQTLVHGCSSLWPHQSKQLLPALNQAKPPVIMLFANNHLFIIPPTWHTVAWQISCKCINAHSLSQLKHKPAYRNCYM